MIAAPATALTVSGSTPASNRTATTNKLKPPVRQLCRGQASGVARYGGIFDALRPCDIARPSNRAIRTSSRSYRCLDAELARSAPTPLTPLPASEGESRDASTGRTVATHGRGRTRRAWRCRPEESRKSTTRIKHRVLAAGTHQNFIVASWIPARFVTGFAFCIEKSQCLQTRS